jgi:multiple antibiotic resistance protein
MTSHSLYAFSLSEIFTFLFIMIGPLRVVGPFAALTAGSDTAALRRIALRSIGIATVIFIGGAFLGSAMIKKWDVSAGALAITTGLVLLLVALPAVLARHVSTAPEEPRVSEKSVTRRAIMSMVYPFGIATLILFVSLMPEQSLGIVGALIAVMILNLIATLFVRPLLARAGVALQVIGMILGVLQVALAVQAIVYGVHLIAVESFGFTTSSPR